MNGRVCRLKQVFNALRKSSHGHSTINLMTKHVLSFFSDKYFILLKAASQSYKFPSDTSIIVRNEAL